MVQQINSLKDIFYKTYKKENDQNQRKQRGKKLVTNEEICTRLSADFSGEIYRLGKKCDDIFKVLKVREKKKPCQQRILCQSIFFRIEGKVKTFSDKQKLRELITTRLNLQVVVERMLTSNIKIYITLVKVSI